MVWLSDLLKNLSTIDTKTPPITPNNPEENEINEKAHQTIINVKQTILITSNISDTKWVENVMDAVFKYKTLPQSVTNQIHLFQWIKTKELPSALSVLAQVDAVPFYAQTYKL